MNPGSSLKINVIFAPGTTSDQLEVAKGIFEFQEVADLIPQVNRSK
jgi:hypothetical protein